MTQAQTFRQAGSTWLEALPNDVRRGGKPLATNTRRAYKMAFNRVSEVLGERRLNAFDGDVIKDYVAKRRREESKPATICLDLAVIKLVVESKTDKGIPIYPLRINKNYARVPEVVPEEQNTPLANREHIEIALGDPEVSGHVAIAAGLGLRVSEILTLRVGDCPGRDSWDAEAADGGVIYVRATLKTRSAKRAVPVPAELNQFLIGLAAGKAVGDLLFTVTRTRLYERLEELGIPPMHSYRRFFVTEKEKCQTPMNPSALKYIIGHSKGRDVTSRYNFATTDRPFLRAEMERCPIGFSIPVVVPITEPAREVEMATA